MMQLVGVQDLIEIEAIEREEALKRVKHLVRRYDLAADEVFPNSSAERKPIARGKPAARHFDPFFDAW